MSDNAILAAMRRADIGKDEMSGHGFRAVARTILDEVLVYARITSNTSLPMPSEIRMGELTTAQLICRNAER
jgi:hypothetical protein